MRTFPRDAAHAEPTMIPLDHTVRTPGRADLHEAAPVETRPAASGAAADTESRLGDRVDILVVALRWTTVAIGTVVAYSETGVKTPTLHIAVAVLIANTIWRTLAPIRSRAGSGNVRSQVAVVLDLAVCVSAAAMTGALDSPFGLTPLPAVVLAGFGWGYHEGVFAGFLALTPLVAVDATLEQPVETRFVAQLGMVLLLSGVVGGFTRRLAMEAEARRQEALSQLARMARANELLLALHNVAQTLPSSLDLGDVVASSRARFRELFDLTAATIVVYDDTTGSWRVELADGVRLSPAIASGDLPHPLGLAAASPHAIVITDLLRLDHPGCQPLARSGLYAPLRARGNVIGLVAIENTAPRVYTEADAQILDGLADALALALDNAVWFARLRTLGAEAERARIARDLHDRLAQSLAYVAFELERLAEKIEGDELTELRDLVRAVVTELRETLYELRAGVTEHTDLEDVARDFLRRYEERTGIRVSFKARNPAPRLPIQIEQELWRILQEALTNAERHAQASHVWVTWVVAGGHAWLEIRDDGRGFQTEDAKRERFGLVGMRERAAAIGAHLTIDSAPGAGARILVDLEVPT